jgi:DNA (cytosine-5)-methyltransferase 1
MTKKKNSYITVTDQFCGAGGSSLGVTGAGGEVKLAMNHWKLAIETHNTNFPNVDHVCTDISACDPRRYPSTDILITSPECTNHSLAKGKKRKHQRQMRMFEDNNVVLPTDAEERSRATMWDVPRFAEYHDYNLIIVENVVDARNWRMWESWLHAMTVSLDYDYKVVYLNSMHCWPTPQSRDRMYVVFWKRGNRAPKLDFNPPAWCPKCQKNVDSVQSWKNPKKQYGKYKQQYLYCCPNCATTVEPYYYCAANAIDWSIPVERISDRKKPLKEKTLARIRAGLEKFGRQEFLTFPNQSGNRNRPVSAAYPTQTATLGPALVMPYLVDTAYTGDDRVYGLEGVLPTQSTRQTIGLAVPPLIVEMWNTSTARPVTNPLACVVAGGNHHYLAVPPWLMGNYTPGTHKRLTDAMGTVTTQDHHSLVVPPGFLTSYYGSDKGGHDLTGPLGTVTTVDRHALTVPPFIVEYYTRANPERNSRAITEALNTQCAQPRHYLVQPGDASAFAEEIKAEDCGFRMLQPHEIGAAMAFPADYKVLGNARQRVKQYGNAVTPPAMRALAERCIASLA